MEPVIHSWFSLTTETWSISEGPEPTPSLVGFVFLLVSSFPSLITRDLRMVKQTHCPGNMKLEILLLFRNPFFRPL